MSGPVRPEDVQGAASAPDDLEVTEGRHASVGGLDIIRVLPTKGRRTVGAWCFVDCMLPPDVQDPDPMEVGPHPHIGLSTVTWLFAGEAVHGDSLGTEQLIRPGQLNLMTAGNGIAHAELGLGTGLHGIQMWVAQPDTTRHGEPAFEHHGDLPLADLTGPGGVIGDATVFMGSLDGVTSPARQDTPMVGAEMRLGTGEAVVRTDTAFEHAVVPLDTPVKVGDTVVEPGFLGFVPAGRDHLRIEGSQAGGRTMFLGGTPFETVMMWWNFVGRTREELTQAWSDWQGHDTDRFGPVDSQLSRIEAPRPPWTRG